MNSSKRISHIGIAVSNLESANAWYRDVLNLLFEGTETIDSEQVRVSFFRVGESRIELLEPLSEESPIAKFIKKRGEGIHHIAFEVEDIQERIRVLSAKGVDFIHDVPKVGAHQSLISFLHPRSTGGVLIELCQSLSSERGIGREYDDA